MSLEDAVATTLAQVDPLAHPTVALAVALAAPSDGPLADIAYAGFYEEANCDGIHLIVEVTYMGANRVLDYLEYEPLPGTATPNPDFTDVSMSLIEVHCASTGELVASVPWYTDEELWGIDGTSVPLRTVTPDLSSTIVTATRQSQPTAGPTEPPLPSGRAVALDEMTQSSRRSLQAFPLIPGSSWTYLARAYRGGRSSRWMVTETVRTAILLPGDRLLSTIDVDRSARAGARHVGESGFGWRSLTNGPTQGESYWLVDGGDFYRLASPSDVLAKVEELDAEPPPPWPTAWPDDSHWLRWPARAGDSWSQAPGQPMGEHAYAIWHSPAQAGVSVKAGRFDDCMVTALEHNTGGLHNWFCPGVGFVRLQGSGWSTVPDQGYTVAELVDWRIPDQSER